MILVVRVAVFASGSGVKPGLPMPIQTQFPHIQLKLATELGGANNPLIRSVLGTAAALSTGNFHYFAKIAKAFPHDVAKIHPPKEYSPILLSGIVQCHGESVTTELQVAF